MRERNKPTKTWLEKAREELANEKELTIERAYELGKIRGRKETIEDACECYCKASSCDINDFKCVDECGGCLEIRRFIKLMRNKI